MWAPSVLVKGNLEYREEVEKSFGGVKAKPLLSNLIRDEELKTNSGRRFGEPLSGYYAKLHTL